MCIDAALRMRPAEEHSAPALLGDCLQEPCSEYQEAASVARDANPELWASVCGFFLYLSVSSRFAI